MAAVVSNMPTKKCLNTGKISVIKQSTGALEAWIDPLAEDLQIKFAHNISLVECYSVHKDLLEIW